MKFYVGLTDKNWFDFLKGIPREDVNFWRPSGGNFTAIPYGAPFLLRLKAPYNVIAGVGFFTNHIILPITVAWDIFKERNGTESFSDFSATIQRFRKNNRSNYEANPQVGCTVLTDPIFFKSEDWIPSPPDWKAPIVQGKSYDTTSHIGDALWEEVMQKLLIYRTQSPTTNLSQSNLAFEEPAVYKNILSSVRVGQGAFRVMITNAYARKCAISGEKTLPVLQAAHILPYASNGPNQTFNGLLLRSDLHTLFDSNYITVDATNLRVNVSKRIKEEFLNGKEYYRFHGEKLASLPKVIEDQPSKHLLQLHNDRFLG